MVYRGGGQPGNKNAEKWTEPIALALGNSLMKWLKKDANNVYYAEFLHVVNDYPADILQDLARKFESFSDLKKRMDIIQEMKLCKIGTSKHPTMPIFVLKNKHKWEDKKNIDHSTKGEALTALLQEHFPAAEV